MPPPGPFVLFCTTYVVLAGIEEGFEMSQPDPPDRSEVVTPPRDVRHDVRLDALNVLDHTLDVRTTDGSPR